MGAKLAVDMSVIFMLGSKLYKQHKGIVFLRECLQNAIDAHSTRIDVSMYSGGHFEITVKDNGTGIDNFEKYFLTIGGSSKRGEAGAIGGYGIAKLSIMSMDDWSIKSLAGYLTRNDLVNGLDFSGESCKGCEVRGVLKGGWYRGEDEVKSYLRLIRESAGCDIYLDGELIEAVSTCEVVLSNGGKMLVLNETLARYRKVFIVRLNGLPQFIDSYYAGEEEDSYIFDIQTMSSPYDEFYPLTANRESINESVEEYKIYNDNRQTLCHMLDEKQEAQKVTRANIRFEGDSLLGGMATKKYFKLHSFEFKTFERYVFQLCDLLSLNKSDYKIGLTDDSSLKAAYYEDLKYFMLNPINSGRDKGTLLSLAIHEVSHIFIGAHYDDFAVKCTEITSQVFSKLSIKEFRW